LQPAQLAARQPEQPEDSERTSPPLPRLRAENPEKSFSTFRERHLGQETSFSDFEPKISSSK
jgi:hypothetical protein